MWTPDVYEGSPTPVTAFFATAPKVAAAAMFARVLFGAFGGAVPEWQQILSFPALISMFLGSIAAIGQRDIKRLMAYSSIGPYGLCADGACSRHRARAVQALLIYLAIYVVMSVGTFAFILNMEKGGEPVTDIACSGFTARSSRRGGLPSRSRCSVSRVSRRWSVLRQVLRAQGRDRCGLIWLAVGGMIASVIGAFYHLRIVYLMYFGQPADALDGKMPLLHWGLLAASALVMVVGVVNLFGVDALPLRPPRRLCPDT